MLTGPEIRRIREKLGLTQAQAASLLDVHSVTWCRWESGALAPSPYQAALIQRFGAAAVHPACPRDLGVALVATGPLSVLVSLLLLSGGAEGRPGRRRARRKTEVSRSRPARLPGHVP